MLWNGMEKTVSENPLGKIIFAFNWLGSAEEVQRKFYDLEDGDEVDEDEPIAIVGKDKVSWSEHLRHIEEFGAWAFCRPPSNGELVATIYVWCDDSVPFEKMMFVLCHEIGHVYDDFYAQVEDDCLRANLFGMASSTALREIIRARPSVLGIFSNGAPN